MFDNNIFGEPARSSKNTVFMGDYVNRDLAPTSSLGVAYFSEGKSSKLFLNVAYPTSKLKNPDFKICDNGDALLRLNTDDLDKMNDFEKSECTILFGDLNNLMAGEVALHIDREFMPLTIADKALFDDDFKVILITRNEEKKIDGKFVGQKYSFNEVRFDAFELENDDVNAYSLEKEKDDDMSFFNEIDLELNKELNKMNLKPVVVAEKRVNGKKKSFSKQKFNNNYNKFKKNNEK